MTEQDQAELKRAKELLEKSNVAVKLTNALGYPIEKGLTLLPARWSGAVQKATHEALMRALDFAVTTLGSQGRPSSNRLHRAMVAVAGAAGGMAGIPTLLVELPVSTTIMLRSIADIARSEGEDVHSLDCRMACLEVFALGGRTSRETAAETGYFAVRAALARSVSEAARYIAERGLLEEGAPVIVRFVAAIASRFQIAVSEKALAQAVPLIGAAGGAVVNTVFIDHFQDIARGHFIIRRLERKYGAAEIEALFGNSPIQGGREPERRWRWPLLGLVRRH